MFLHPGDDDETVYVIPQVSHAWLAWQVGSRWGRRPFLRPELKAETLAAVLLHDSGWVESDERPEVDEEGRPRSFDRMLPAAHLKIWRSSVNRVAAHSRFAALLVAAHFGFLAGLKCRDLLDRDDTAGARMAQSFVAEMERLQGVWREQLAGDPRYADFVEGPRWERCRSFLAVCDRISVYLCAQLAEAFEFAAFTKTGEEEIRFRHLGGGRWRVEPWPFQGAELELHCEARRLGARRFADDRRLQKAVSEAPSARLAFCLQGPGAARG